MFVVYILRGKSGRHYIGMTSNFEARFAQHVNGHRHTTKRLGGSSDLMGKRSYPSREEAAKIERLLKSWKNPAKTVAFLNAT